MNLQNLFMMIIHWFFSEATFVVKKHSGFPNVAMEKIPCAINLRKVHLPFAILVYQRIAIYQAICQMVRDIFRKSCIRYTWKTCEKKKKTPLNFHGPGLFHRCLSSENGKDLQSRSEGRKLPKKDGGRSSCERQKRSCCFP